MVKFLFVDDFLGFANLKAIISFSRLELREIASYTWQDERLSIVVTIGTNTQTNLFGICVFLVRFSNAQDCVRWAHFDMRPPRTAEKWHPYV